jgi:Tfp pilus assembly protein PilF
LKAAARALATGIALAAFVAFLPALDGQWLNWDDEVNFVHNLHYRGLGPAQLEWMLTTTLLAVYAPLAWITLGLNYVLGGMDPWGYHLGNMLVHAASAVLCFLIARRLLAAGAEETPTAPGVLPGAVVAALVFAVHPLRVESVAWVTERRDVLSALLYLAAVLAYLRGVERPGPLRGGWRIAALAALAAALAAKGLAMTLPASLLVLDVYPLRRHRTLGWAALAREKLPFFGLAALGALAALWAVSEGARWTPYAEQGPGARVAMIGYSLWFYPSRFAWPVGLSPYYEMPEHVRLADPRFLLPVLAVVGVSAALVAARRRWPAGLAAWTHSAIAIAPVSGVVHAGAQLAHDRFAYLSGLGFALLAGAAVAWVARRRRAGQVSAPVQAAVAGVAAIAIAGLGAQTWEQSKVWRSSEALWRAAVDADAGCALCRTNLGNALYGQQQLRAAEREYRLAAGLRPRRAEPLNNLGMALAAQHRYAEAEPAFRAALALEPHMAGALANLGQLYADQERWAEAAPLLSRAIALGADMPAVRAAAARVARHMPR